MQAIMQLNLTLCFRFCFGISKSACLNEMFQSHWKYHSMGHSWILSLMALYLINDTKWWICHLASSYNTFCAGCNGSRSSTLAVWSDSYSLGRHWGNITPPILESSGFQCQNGFGLARKVWSNLHALCHQRDGLWWFEAGIQQDHDWIWGLQWGSRGRWPTQRASFSNSLLSFFLIIISVNFSKKAIFQNSKTISCQTLHILMLLFCIL